MKERIEVWPPVRHEWSRCVKRVLFDLCEYWIQNPTATVALTGHDGHWKEEGWVRYRAGRLFVRRVSEPLKEFGGECHWGPWTPFSFEPKNGSAYDV